jgi:hypothetical protein
MDLQQLLMYPRQQQQVLRIHWFSMASCRLQLYPWPVLKGLRLQWLVLRTGFSSKELKEHLRALKDFHLRALKHLLMYLGKGSVPDQWTQEHVTDVQAVSLANELVNLQLWCFQRLKHPRLKKMNSKQEKEPRARHGKRWKMRTITLMMYPREKDGANMNPRVQEGDPRIL